MGVPLDIFYMISFTWVGMVCFLYPVKRFANPDPNGDSFTVKNEFMGVFFTPRSYWFIYLDFALQRPVRLVNRMLFELVAEGIKRALDQWRQRDLHGKADGSDLGSTSDISASRTLRTGSPQSCLNSENIAYTRWPVAEELYENPWNDWDTSNRDDISPERYISQPREDHSNLLYMVKPSVWAAANSGRGTRAEWSIYKVPGIHPSVSHKEQTELWVEISSRIRSRGRRTGGYGGLRRLGRTQGSIRLRQSC